MRIVKRWNHRIEPRISWVTGLPTLPAKPCKCGEEATTWVASDYVTGSRGRIATRYQPCCQTCSLKITTTPTTETMNMPRTATKKNSKKTAEVTPAYTAKELELREKYPNHNILAGSYRVAGAEDRPGWGRKHTVLIACCYEGCVAQPRCLATSDLQFDTTKYCIDHAKVIKANRRRTAQVKKKL